MHYIAIIHHDPGSAYGVSFPDVPDCFAAADDEKDVLKNAIAALDDYFADGHPLPAPRSIEDIRAEVAEDLAEGAYLILVPLIPRPTKSERVNLSLDRGLLQAIDEAADLVGLNRSAFIAMAARKEIERDQAA
ncbi:type II toxin-antitoxin system HicB family antitoxin [Albibacillus kandeliae]|uniref:type II toxin-antitoxin system HicB family antitoxin n=1 Tax=Albibacillus kandeliae TaxID=2174228 RepID=UPI000D686A1D|nr:type II toxin-antitoxin system HicB family antitoxin [Albibacillus kandeliae]